MHSTVAAESEEAPAIPEEFASEIYAIETWSSVHIPQLGVIRNPLSIYGIMT